MQVLKQFLDAARKHVLPTVYALAGWDQFLLCPPVDNVRNVMDFPLYIPHFQVGVEWKLVLAN